MRLKKLISFLILFIFLTPLTVKFLDGFSHHHEHFECNATENDRHFHQHHDECPILHYEFAFFTFQQSYFETFIKVAINDFVIENFLNFCCTSSEYSFLLRAPPVGR